LGHLLSRDSFRILLFIEFQFLIDVFNLNGVEHEVCAPARRSSGHVRRLVETRRASGGFVI
jgi:hypothetical protein